MRTPTLIIVGDLHGPEGIETGFEPWRVPFLGWDESRELRAMARCVPRRYTVLDGLVRAAGYTATPLCLPGEPFVIRVGSPLAA